MSTDISLTDATSELHEIASAISRAYPAQCGRLHYLADVLGDALADRIETESALPPAPPRRPKKGATARARGTAPASKRLICTTCGKAFKKRGYYERHIARHAAPPAADSTTPATIP